MVKKYLVFTHDQTIKKRVVGKMSIFTPRQFFSLVIWFLYFLDGDRETRIKFLHQTRLIYGHLTALEVKKWIEQQNYSQSKKEVRQYGCHCNKYGICGACWS